MSNIIQAALLDLPPATTRTDISKALKLAIAQLKKHRRTFATPHAMYLQGFESQANGAKQYVEITRAIDTLTILMEAIRTKPH